MNEHKEFLSNIEYTSKPVTPEDVHSEIDCLSIPHSQIQTLHMLPYIDSNKFAEYGFSTDAFEEYRKRDDEGRTIYHPQYWLTEHDGEWYLIDNQGFTYARYVTRLNNYRRIKNYNYSVAQVVI